MAELKPGIRAPDFDVAGADSQRFCLSDFAGKKLVLYFYPKDDTPGCTREAIDFTDAARAFADADTAILGVSRDSTASHAKFRDKHGLAFDLGADTEGTVTGAYGVWVEKSLYGRKYMGIERATFLIGRDGRIAETWRKVKVPGHVDAVLKAARALG